ncbi:MAG: hypothetical protein R2856_19160 [Caldilineaceae bacterium]
MAPKGDYLVISGKLDPHVTIFSFEKLQQAIANQDWTLDDYGVPVLNFDSVMERRSRSALARCTPSSTTRATPTPAFTPTAPWRWTLGGDYGHADEAWTLIDKESIHYNVGHIAAVEGDTVEPGGNFWWRSTSGRWIALTTSAVAAAEPATHRHRRRRGSLQLLYDMPMGIGEPHYAQIIKAERLNPVQVYPETGWDPGTWAVDPNAAKPGEERIERNGNEVEIWMTAVRSHFTPEHVEIKQGDHVTWHITNIDAGRRRPRLCGALATTST